MNQVFDSEAIIISVRLKLGDDCV